MITKEIINVYAEICTAAVPIAVTFSFGNLIVSSFLRMAFGGRVEF